MASSESAILQLELQANGGFDLTWTGTGWQLVSNGS
jgi:hypothetical protein